MKSVHDLGIWKILAGANEEEEKETKSVEHMEIGGNDFVVYHNKPMGLAA